MPLYLIEGGRAELRDWAQDLGDSRVWVRQRAAARMEESPEQARAVVVELAAALCDADPKVRQSAGRALAQVGAEALPHILPLLACPRPVVREWACALLSHLGQQARSAEEALWQLTVKDPYWEVRSAAAAALRRMRGLEPCAP